MGYPHFKYYNDRLRKAVFCGQVEGHRIRGRPKTKCKDNNHNDMDTVSLGRSQWGRSVE